MSKTKVLMLVPDLQVANGVASFVMNYLQNLDHNAVQMDIVSYRKGTSPYYSEVKSFGGNVYFLPSIKNLPLHIKMCNQILNEGQYDFIHDNTLHISIPMMICAKRMGVPVRILHSHSSKLGETPWKNFRNKLFLPFLKAQMTDAFACSELAGRAMFGNKPFTVVPNVIDVDRFKFDPYTRERVRTEMGCTDKYIIGSVGRLSPQKNPFFAMDVFRAVHERMPNAEYWWIGTGIMDEEVKAYADKLGLHDCVRFLGSRSDVNELYQAMDVFFMPSRFEGLGIACIEAQASGLNCVVSTELPSEVNVTEQVQFVSLRCDIETWAEKIVDVITKKRREDSCYEQIINSPFYCKASDDYLTEIYSAIVGKTK